MNRSYRTIFMALLCKIGLNAARKSRSAFSHSLFTFVALVACSTIVLAPAAVAQVTSGNIAGTITTSDGSGLPGVTVEAVHVPTGTHYSTVSGASGYYSIPNARIGGPYRITANLEGFRSITMERIQVPLGETANVRSTHVVVLAGPPQIPIDEEHRLSQQSHGDRQVGRDEALAFLLH